MVQVGGDMGKPYCKAIILPLKIINLKNLSVLRHVIFLFN